MIFVMKKPKVSVPSNGMFPTSTERNRCSRDGGIAMVRVDGNQGWASCEPA
jgi:hypothetical protein